MDPNEVLVPHVLCCDASCFNCVGRSFLLLTCLVQARHTVAGQNRMSIYAADVETSLVPSRDGNWTRGCGHPRVLDPMGAGADPKRDPRVHPHPQFHAGADPDFHPRVHPHPPETNKAQPKWSKPSPICVIYIRNPSLSLTLSLTPPSPGGRSAAWRPSPPFPIPIPSPNLSPSASRLAPAARDGQRAPLAPTTEAAICGHVAAAAASSTMKMVANRRGAVAKSTKPAGARDPPETRRVRVQKSIRGSCRGRVFPCSAGWPRVGFCQTRTRTRGCHP